MRASLYFMAIAFNLVLLSCNCPDDPKIIENQLLLNCWINAREEQSNPDTLIYRHCDYAEWPISRYRNQFTLEEDSKGRFLVLNPYDAHYFTDCTWSYDEENQLIILFIPEWNEKIQFNILELTEDKLVGTWE